MKYSILLISFLALAACQSNSPAEAPAATPAADEWAPGLAELFEAVTVVKMHVFSIADPAGHPDYPYEGKMLEGDMLSVLDEALTQNVAGKHYACYQLQNDLYLLRGPGKYDDSDVILCQKPAGGKLKEINRAYRWCDEGYCNQQDIWLTDLNADNKLEIVVRSASTTAAGQKENEQFEVWVQDGEGNFSKGDPLLANASSYVLATE